MSKHAKYGGSTAYRTMNCPAWHKLSEDAPKQRESPAAALGTALHEVIEKCLLDVDLDPYDLVGKASNGVMITNEHITEKVYPALDEFEKLMDTYDLVDYWVEEWVEVSEDIAGTADFIGMSRDRKTMVFADYKSGDGYMVYAENNSQGLFYAMCAAHEKYKHVMQTVERVIVAIVQPSFRREEYLDIWETTPEVLQTFTDHHALAVGLAEHKKDPAPVIGSWCSWCPAEPTCPAKKQEVAKVEFIPCTTEYPAEISEALIIADKVESWIKAVRKTAHNLLEQGVHIDGYKLVDKRATRQWVDLPAAEKKVKLAKKLKIADAFDSKLKSPAQLEKVCNSLGIDWDKFSSGLVASISSGTTLVPEADKRQAVVINGAAKVLAERFAQ